MSKRARNLKGRYKGDNKKTKVNYKIIFGKVRPKEDDDD